MSDFVQNMRKERNDLQGRADNLKAFISSDNFNKKSVEVQKVLLRQLGAMTELLICLNQRLAMRGVTS